MAKMIEEKDFEKLVLNNDKAVMVDFFASWCGPCKMIAPIIDELATEFEDEADVFKLDIDENESLCERFSISVVPSLLFFKDGECVDKLVGVVNKDDIIQKLKELM